MLPACAGKRKAKCGLRALCMRAFSSRSAVAFASARKGCRGYRVRLFSPATVGLNFQTKGRSELYSYSEFFPCRIKLERPSRMYLHIHLRIPTNPVCVYFLLAYILKSYLEAFLCITILRHFQSVFEHNSFHAHAYVIKPRSL